MTSRQENLIKVLSVEKRWMSQVEICLFIEEYRNVLESSPMYGSTAFNFHDSTARILLTDDIRAINNDLTNPTVILSGSRGAKIANENEVVEYANRLRIHALKKLGRISKIVKKAQLVNQISMDELKAFVEDFDEYSVENVEKPIDND